MYSAFEAFDVDVKRPSGGKKGGEVCGYVLLCEGGEDGRRRRREVG